MGSSCTHMPAALLTWIDVMMMCIEVQRNIMHSHAEDVRRTKREEGMLTALL